MMSELSKEYLSRRFVVYALTHKNPGSAAELILNHEDEIKVLTEALQNLASDYRRTQMGRFMNTQDWVDQYMEQAKRIVESNDVDIS
jgi:hypothetical protein